MRTPTSSQFASAALGCCILIQSAHAHAEPRRTARRVASDPKITTETKTRDLPVYEDQSGTALALFLGAGGNAYSVQPLTGAPRSETEKSGLGFQGRLAGTFYTQDIALDLGVGWMQSRISGGSTTSVSGNTTTTSQADISTKAGFVEFSPRFRLLSGHLEIGPNAGVLFGANASFGVTDAKPDSPIMAGAKIVGAWETKHLRLRVIGQAQTSLTIPERRVVMGSVGLEIGLPLIGGKTIVRETEVRQVEQRLETEYVETQVPVEVVTEVVREVVREVMVFSLDDQVVHFEFDRAELLPQSREFLSQLGAYLADNQQQWSGLQITGHTDNRGTPGYNQALSESRARAVMDALAQAGAPQDRLSSKGVGFGAPIDRGPSDVSHARNRRVELVFSGVPDATGAQALRDAINRIRIQTALPQTCVDGRCR